MMDIKPSRLLRPSRVRNDENMPSNGSINKSFHQRNKSSPALTTVHGGQGLKTMAKRAAFADVSNTAGSSRDDSNLPTKPLMPHASKPLPSLAERKSIALLKPAQRPRSVSSTKALAAGINTAATEHVGVNFLSTDAGTAQQQVFPRKTLSKRPTMIFKDNQSGKAQEQNVISSESVNSIASIQQANDIDLGRAGLDSLPSLPPPISHIVVEPSKSAQDLKSDTSLPGIEEVTLEPTSMYSDACENCSHEDAPVPEPLKLQPNPHHQLASLMPQSHTTQPDLNINALKPLEVKQFSVANIINPTTHIPALSAHHIHHEQGMEQEEYWDDEDDENYDEEGYVTARSFRSKGDNTTGGGTAVLFPQVNNLVRKELSAAKHLVEATRSPEEIEDESYDTSMVAEYGDEIFDYMQQLEVKMLPNAHYMDNQHEIQWSMRSVLMDWLVQVHHRFNLLPETLFLCVNYIDRFLSCKVVSLAKLQLVGATAIFIAAKYEEINCPSVQEIVYMVDGGYTMDEILKAERFMLTMLQFELGWPGPMSFLRRISKADDYDLETRTLAKYFLEVTLMDERFIGSPPSFTAAASHCLSRMMLRKGTWTPHHVFYSGYTLSQLRPLLSLLLECCEDPRKHHSAVYNKYCDKRYKRASAFVESEMQRGFQLADALPLPILSPPTNYPIYNNISFFRG